MPLTDFLSSLPPAGLAPRRPFIKMQGLRNHFVFVDLRHGAPPPGRDEIVRICDVHAGVGAEQVIAVEQPSPAAAAQGAYAFMRIFNVDGTEAEACGNATRCMASLLFEEAGRDEILIDSRGGLLPCRKARDGLISVTLGPIATDWRSVPLASAMDTSHLPFASGPLQDGMAFSVGNPHVVFFVPDLSKVDIPAFAPDIAADPALPQGANISVAQVLGGASLRMATWERPGILTEACGTGACAAAYAGRARGLLDSGRIEVECPGGMLQIELLSDGRAIKTGPATLCCAGFV